MKYIELRERSKDEIINILFDTHYELLGLVEQIKSLKELNKVLDSMVRERQIKIDKAIKYCKESNVTMKSEYFKDVLKILEDNEDINETVRLIERDKMGIMERKDNIVNDLLGRVGELERTIEEIRDFLLHSSLSIEDMEKIDKIIG